MRKKSQGLWKFARVGLDAADEIRPRVIQRGEERCDRPWHKRASPSFPLAILKMRVFDVLLLFPSLSMSMSCNGPPFMGTETSTA